MNIMKRLFFVTLALFTVAVCSAQETEEEGASVYVGDNNVVSSKNGMLSLFLNGATIEIGQRESDISGDAAYADMVEAINDEPISSGRRAYFGFLGIGAPYFNHFALFEFGTNSFVGADYSAYTPSEASDMMFNVYRSFSFTANLGTLNVSLNQKRTLALSFAFSTTIDRYGFMSAHTLEFRDGMMRPVALDEGYTRSLMTASYFRLPVTLDWNITRTAFVSVGVNLDVLIGAKLIYKKPRTTVEGTVTLNPVQLGVTARVGWKRLYGYVNYSFNDLFKRGTGPEGKRLSVGVGLWF